MPPTFHIPGVSARLRALALAFLFTGSQPALTAPKIIVNDEVSVAAIDSTYLSQIFAMQIRKWPNGQAIQAYTLDSTNNLHREFVIERLKIQTHQLDRIWNRMLFTGTGKAPTAVTSEEDMFNAVKNTPGAIGYVSEKFSTTDGVTVLQEVQL